MNTTSMIAPLRPIFASCIAIAMFSQNVPGSAEEVAKLPVPDQAEQKEAAKLIGEVYKADYDKAKKPADKAALARKLLAQGLETRNDAVGRFVLLRIAKDIAVGLGDLTTGLSAIEALDKDYQIEAWPMKVDAALGVERALKASKDHQTLAEPIRTLIGQAAAEDRWDVAQELSRLAISSARKANDAPTLKRAVGHGKDVDTSTAAFRDSMAARKVLEGQPTDPEANLTVGKFYCFVKHDWSQGLPMLALGSDEGLKILGKQELDPPVDAEAQVKLADAWWAYADGAAAPAAESAQIRAVHWYERAAPNLTGLAKARVDKRLADKQGLARGTDDQPRPAKPPDNWVELFDGKTLSGWKPTLPIAQPNWSANDGLLINHGPGPSLRTEGTFTDFELHLEFRLPANCNSGIYLRGRYEVQLVDTAMVQGQIIHRGAPIARNQSTGAIVSQIAPTMDDVYQGPQKWNTLDITLIGKTVTVTLNRRPIIASKQISFVTAEALDARESEPGPIMLQCRSTPNGASFRNVRFRPLP